MEGLSLLTLLKSNKYTDDSLMGLGALKGSPCAIREVTRENNGTKVIFEWETNTGVYRKSEIFIRDGNHVSSASVNDKNELILTMSDNTIINAGTITINEGSVILDTFYTKQEIDEKFSNLNSELNILIPKKIDEKFKPIAFNEIDGLF